MANLEVGIDGRRAKAGASTVTRSIEDIRKSSRRADKQMNQLDRTIDKAGDSAKDTARDFSRADKELKKTTRTASRLNRVLGGLSAVLIARQVVRYADSWTQVTNQLASVITENEAFVTAQADVIRIAQETRAPIGQLAKLYGQTTAAAEELGITQTQIARITELTGKAIAVAGSDANTASGAILQLTQLLGGGVVQAQEFNSIIDGARPLLKAVALGIDRFGGSVAKLREEVRGGNFQVSEFVEGLERGGRILDEQFGRTTRTVGQAFIQLDNALTVFVGRVNESERATTPLVDAIDNLIDLLNDPATLEAAKKITAALVEGATSALNVVVQLTEEYESLNTAVKEISEQQFSADSFGDFADAFFQSLKNVSDAADSTGDEFQDLINRASELDDAIRETGGQGTLQSFLNFDFFQVINGFDRTKQAVAEFQDVIFEGLPEFLSDASRPELLNTIVEANGQILDLTQAIIEEQGKTRPSEQNIALLEDAIMRWQDIVDFSGQALENQRRIADEPIAPIEEAPRLEQPTIASDRQIKEINKIIAEGRTPFQEYNAEVQRLLELSFLVDKETGDVVLSQEEFAKAVQRAGDEMREAEQKASGYNTKLSEAEKFIESAKTETEKFLEEQERIKQLFDEGFFGTGAEGLATFNRVMQVAQREATGFNDKLERAKEIMEDTKTEAEKLADAQSEINSLFNEGFFGEGEQAVIFRDRALEKAKEEFSDTVDFMQEASKQAARNIQSAFADFLFDPLNDGLEGFATNFLNVIRRVLAESASVEILDFIGFDENTVGDTIDRIFGSITSRAGEEAAAGAVTTATTGAVTTGAEVATTAVGGAAEAATDTATATALTTAATTLSTAATGLTTAVTGLTTGATTLQTATTTFQTTLATLQPTITTLTTTVTTLQAAATGLTTAGSTLTSAGGTLSASATGLTSAGGSLTAAGGTLTGAGGILNGAGGLLTGAGTGLVTAGGSLTVAAGALTSAATALAAGGGGGGGGAGSLIGSLFGNLGGAQFGKGVDAGVPIRVGEGGREEVFIPSENGRVLSKQRAGAALNNGGGAPNVEVPVNINNVFSDDLVIEALGSSAGERVIMNVLQKNQSTVQRIAN